ncbi:MAG TPA: hypothetical protein VNV63_08260 [Nitrospiria bacterium]|jgi:hypothetical protein|nr:hypothetical protein [Nitrospiria bacterium]
MVAETFLIMALALPAHQNQLDRLRAFLAQTHCHYDVKLGEQPGVGWKMMPFLFEGRHIWAREKLKEAA